MSKGKPVLRRNINSRTMAEEIYECPECGKVFGEEETLEEHIRLEHEETAGDGLETPKLGRYLDSSFLTGMVFGILLASAAFSSYMYWDSMDHRTEVPITVVTCDTCEWESFRESTDRMFRTDYREVDYSSEEGQKIVEKYNLKYVPGFVFDKEKLRESGNFTVVEPSLVEFEDAYVIPDEGVRTAQRLSEGKSLDN